MRHYTKPDLKQSILLINQGYAGQQQTVQTTCITDLLILISGILQLHLPLKLFFYSGIF